MSEQFPENIEDISLLTFSKSKLVIALLASVIVDGQFVTGIKAIFLANQKHKFYKAKCTCFISF